MLLLTKYCSIALGRTVTSRAVSVRPFERFSHPSLARPSPPRRGALPFSGRPADRDMSGLSLVVLGLYLLPGLLLASTDVAAAVTGSLAPLPSPSPSSFPDTLPHGLLKAVETQIGRGSLRGIELITLSYMELLNSTKLVVTNAGPRRPETCSVPCKGHPIGRVLALVVSLLLH